jgi:hypothetical protein
MLARRSKRAILAFAALLLFVAVLLAVTGRYFQVVEPEEDNTITHTSVVSTSVTNTDVVNNNGLAYTVVNTGVDTTGLPPNFIFNPNIFNDINDPIVNYFEDDSVPVVNDTDTDSDNDN